MRVSSPAVHFFPIREKKVVRESEKNNYRVLIGEFMLRCSLVFFRISPIGNFF
jgi:hypothetical protein